MEFTRKMPELARKSTMERVFRTDVFLIKIKKKEITNGRTRIAKLKREIIFSGFKAFAFEKVNWLERFP